MIAKLQNPVTSAVIGLVLSLGVGLGVSWPTLSKALHQAVDAAALAATQQNAEPDKQKKKGWDFWTIEIENLSNELKEERLRLRQQAESLDHRAARLAAEEKEFEKVRADVELLRRDIADRVVEIAADETKNLRSLAQTYTNLTPRAAVAIIRELDDTTAVKILSLMKPDVVGPIFEEMSNPRSADAAVARRAAILSEKLRLMKATKPTPPS